MSRSTKKRPGYGRPVWLVFAVFTIFLMNVMTFGCGEFITINPTTDEQAWENLGRDVGSYMKTTKDAEWIADSKEWADGIIALSDGDLLAGDPLQVAYEQLLKQYPDKAGEILLVKSTLTLMGVKVNLNIDTATDDEKSVYIKCTRAVLKGYSEVVG